MAPFTAGRFRNREFDKTVKRFVQPTRTMQLPGNLSPDLDDLSAADADRIVQ